MVVMITDQDTSSCFCLGLGIFSFFRSVYASFSIYQRRPFLFLLEQRHRESLHLAYILCISTQYNLSYTSSNIIVNHIMQTKPYLRCKEASIGHAYERQIMFVEMSAGGFIDSQRINPLDNMGREFVRFVGASACDERRVKLLGCCSIAAWLGFRRVEF